MNTEDKDKMPETPPLNNDVSESNETENSTQQSALQADPAQGRFSLDETGHIFWQKDSSNPTPGHAVAMINKGEDMFAPVVAVIEGASYRDGRDLKEDTASWLTSHIDEVLGGITRFAAAEALPEPLKDIARQLKKNGGVAERYKVERSIAQLDPDMRRILRQHKVRLGPLLVFFQDLLKPAPLKLKSILWGVYHDRDLPMKRPKDGIVSEVLEDDQIDYPYHRMLGYPVFAKRAIRIDMLDRVVTDIYEQADAGTFRAQHKYAEWLGCSLESLYAVLEAMGHFKVEDPAAPADENPVSADNAEDSTNELKQEAQADASEVSEKKAVVKEEEDTSEGAKTAQPDTAAQASEEVKAPEQKPLLALFKLKKGKLSTAPKPRMTHKTSNKPDARKGTDEGKASFKPKKSKHDKQKHKKQGPRVIKAEPNKADEDDSPFAVLKNLKLK